MTRQILDADPTFKILIISAHSDDVYVDKIIEAGAVGFLEKHTSAEFHEIVDLSDPLRSDEVAPRWDNTPYAAGLKGRTL